MRVSKRNLYVGIGVAAIVGVVTYVVIRRKNNANKIQQINDILDQKVQDPNTGAGQKIIQKSEYDKLPMGQYPIKFGQKNKRVYEIQKMLNRKYGTSIDLDGRYGESTWNALCDKLWSSWYKVGECYELTKTSPTQSNPTGLIKRYIQQKDFEALK
jgi:hypothetical protein